VNHPDTRAESGKGTGAGRARSLPWVAGIAGALLALLATSRYGAAVSPDSTIYLTAASHLARGAGLAPFDGVPLVRWAPLFPALLAPAAALGLDPAAAARWLNALCFGLFVGLAGVWLARHVRDRRMAAVALAATALSSSLLQCAVYVWSEPLFLVLSLLCLLDLERSARGGSRALLARAAAWAAVAILTRYAGLALLGPGLWISATRRGRTVRDRVTDGVVFGGIALLPLVGWMERNRLVSGTLLGGAATSSYSPLQAGYLALEVLSHWLVPPVGPSPWRAGLAAIALAAGAWAVARAWRAEAREPAGHAPRWPLAPAVVWVATYSVMVIGWTSSAAVEQVNERYLVPLFLPLVGLAFRSLVALCGPRPGARWSRGAALALCLVWLAYPAARTARHMVLYLRDGAGGYSAPAWRASALAAALRGRPDLQPLYSNGPDAASFLAGIDVKLSPRKHAYNSPEAITGDVEELRHALRAVRSGEAHLAWFTTLDRPFLYSVGELDSIFDVREQRALADGAIYSIRERNGR
jgi:hypothetical protein